jgi:hypothetical protein
MFTILLSICRGATGGAVAAVEGGGADGVAGVGVVVSRPGAGRTASSFFHM